MPKLQVREVFRLFGVSEKRNKKGGYALVPFKNDAFNKEFDEDKLEDTLTDLVNDLYSSEAQYPWLKCRFLFDSDTEPNEQETFCIEIGDDERLEIEDISDLIDTGSGIFQFFIFVNPTREDYRWIVVSLCRVYTEQKKTTRNRVVKYWCRRCPLLMTFPILEVP